MARKQVWCEVEAAATIDLDDITEGGPDYDPEELAEVVVPARATNEYGVGYADDGSAVLVDGDGYGYAVPVGSIYQQPYSGRAYEVRDDGPRVKVASIADSKGRTDGDHGYTLYYVPGDEEGRWILNDNAGVTCTNFSIGDLKNDADEACAEEAERLQGEVEAVLAADSGDNFGGQAGSEAEDLMVRWGWIVPEIYTVTQAAEVLGISAQRIRRLCAEGRMGKKVGMVWIISADDIERNRERPGPGKPRKE